MKKLVCTFVMATLLVIVPLGSERAAAATVAAETAVSTGELAACPRGTYRVRRNTRTKKKLLNALIASGIGAAIGGGVGGGRGALIGAGSGAGGYIIYRYVRDRRGRCVPRYVRG